MTSTPPTKRQSRTAFILRAVLATLAAGLLLSGCAADPSQNAGCVGPPSFCNIYFGS
jgi:hypothetical protein